VVSRPPPVASFSLCDLRLFVIKRNYLFFISFFIVGTALALPPLAAPSAPVVQVVAVSAGGGSYAELGGGA